jgi:hypothetical protein
MTLVNKADADRDTIDDYMKELDGLHGRQLSLIHSLEDVSPALLMPLPDELRWAESWCSCFLLCVFAASQGLLRRSWFVRWFFNST